MFASRSLFVNTIILVGIKIDIALLLAGEAATAY